jgi:hypothetical protein
VTSPNDSTTLTPPEQTAFLPAWLSLAAIVLATFCTNIIKSITAVPNITYKASFYMNSLASYIIQITVYQIAALQRTATSMPYQVQAVANISYNVMCWTFQDYKFPGFTTTVVKYTEHALYADSPDCSWAQWTLRGAITLAAVLPYIGYFKYIHQRYDLPFLALQSFISIPLYYAITSSMYNRQRHKFAMQDPEYARAYNKSRDRRRRGGTR